MKSYTDLEQSKKLAEILPIESADMFYRDNGVDVKLMWEHNAPKITSPCWSLAALLEQLDDELVDEDGNSYNLQILKETNQYQLIYSDRWGYCDDIETDYHDWLVDACYEMLLKLYELKML